MREILIDILFHVSNYRTHCIVTRIYRDIINRCSRTNSLPVEDSIEDPSNARAVYGGASTLCVYIIACALNAFLLRLYTRDESTPYPAIIMAVPLVNLETLFVYVVALAVAMLLQRLRVPTGTGLDDNTDGDILKVEKQQIGSEKEIGEAMAGEKTIL